jgi:hypothetical protein
MWLNEPLDIWVIIEKKQLMETDQSGYHIQRHDLHLKPLISLLQLLKQFLCQA